MKKFQILFLTSIILLIAACKELQLPEASFTPSSYSVEVGKTVNFQNTSNNALTFDWNFGDGSNSSEQNPSHAYSEVGSYTVSLHVTNNDGSDEFSQDISVTPVSCWSTLNNLPVARNAHVALALDNKIYLAGGTSDKRFMAYNLTTGKWETKADMLTYIREFLAGCVLNGKIYVIGGWSNDHTFNLIEEYDPAIDKWTSKTLMPSRRWGHAAVSFNGKIYVIGGVLDWPISKFYQTIEIYDPATDSWTTQNPQGKIELTERWGFSICMVNDKIYIIGGSDAIKDLPSGETIQSLDVVEEYDPVLNVCTKKTSMLNARGMLVAGAVDNKVYAIGGAKAWGSTEFCKVVEEYDPVADIWIEKGNMPKGLIAAAACVIDNIIYIPGGGSSNPNDAYDCFYSYDPACNTGQ